MKDRTTRRLTVALAALLIGLSCFAQAVYRAGRCDGAYTLLGGDSVVFAAADAQASTLWILVQSGEGNVILADGYGNASDGLYFHAGDLLLMGTASPYTLYFQGGVVTFAFGGAALDGPAGPVCATGLNGPVVLLAGAAHFVQAQSPSPASLTPARYGSVQSRVTGTLAYTLATGPTAGAPVALPACPPSGCCNPTQAVLSLSAGSPFAVYSMTSSPASDFDYALAPPTQVSASALASPLSGNAPLAVGFTGSASGGLSPYTWDWNFGDGSAHGTAQNTSHTYAAAGTFHPKLTVQDAAGGSSQDTHLTITVGSGLAASAAASPTSGPAPLAVAFTGQASGGTAPYAYAWDFGDGGSSTDRNPSHTYASPRTYHPKLTVADSASRTAVDDHLVITAAGAPVLTASAQGLPLSGQAPLTVSFTGSAANGTPPYSYTWTFGDGGTSAEQNPQHLYSALGSYRVFLTVTDSAGGSATDSHLVVSVLAPPPAPAILSVKKLTSPFRLKVAGGGFTVGCEVLVNGAAVPQTAFKSSSKVLAKGGAALKAMLPKGQSVCVQVRNSDGQTSACFPFAR